MYLQFPLRRFKKLTSCWPPCPAFAPGTTPTSLCEKENFFCHGVLLKARLPVFFKMLDGGIKVVKVDGIKLSIMDEVIKYIYTDQVSITKNRMVKLVKAADKFELSGLLTKSL